MNLNNRIVIYGMGTIFNKYESLINWNEVVQIVDKSDDMLGKRVHELSVVHPNSIINAGDILVIVFSDKFFNEIRDYLIGDLFFDEDQVISFRALLPLSTYYSNELRVFLKNELFGKKIVSTREGELDRYFINNINASDKTALVVWGNYSVRELPSNFDSFDHIIWIITYSQRMEGGYKERKRQLLKNRIPYVFTFLNEMVLVFKKARNMEFEDTAIFVVEHKKYNCIHVKPYKTIAVGSNTDFDYDYEDSQGESITELNPYINECTALYWIWKNIDKEIVGLSHYRRYFYNYELKQRANVLDEYSIKKIFSEGYEIILPELTHLNCSMLDNIKKAVGDDYGIEAFEVVKNEIKKVVPDYYEDFIEIVGGNVLFRCNMFVAEKKIFDDYCQWLFSFLVSATKKIEYKGKSVREKRVMGYFAELMLTVWVRHNKLIIKELPITSI